MTSSYQSRLDQSPEEGVKAPCFTSTISDIALFGEQVHDGLQIPAGKRILVRSQIDLKQNGIWRSSVGAWTRTTDFNQNDDIISSQQVVDSNNDNIYLVKVDNSNFNIGESDITFILSGITGIASEVTVADTGNYYTGANVETVLAEIAAKFNSLGGASITSIDLKPTGTDNEFTISTAWVDKDGASHTTTDATPITISHLTDIQIFKKYRNNAYALGAIDFTTKADLDAYGAPVGFTTARVKYGEGNGIYYYENSAWEWTEDLANVLNYGADNSGVNDSYQSFVDASKAAGENGTLLIPPGKYDLSKPWECLEKNQTIVAHGVIFNNGFVRGHVGINIIGKLIIDPSMFGNRKPFFGVLNVYGQQDSVISFTARNIGGSAHISGNTYRGQCAVSTINGFSEGCGIVSSHCHAQGGIIGYTRTANSVISGRSPVPTLVNGGSGYTDGRWIAPITGGAGSGAILAFDVVGGTVTDFMVIQSGKDYVVGDIISIDRVKSVNKDQGVLPAGGSGLSIRVEAVIDSRSWFNQNSLNISANGGWYGGLISYGRFNYTVIKLYIEALWTRSDSPIYFDEGVDVVYNELYMLVNSGVGETTNRATKLVDMPNAYGTTVIVGRSGNPYSTDADPYNLFNFGNNSHVGGLDAFSSVSATRGKPKRSFVPLLRSSSPTSDLVPFYTAQYGRYEESRGVIRFSLLLEFDTNAFVNHIGNLYVDISELTNKVGKPSGILPQWKVDIGETKRIDFNVNLGRIFAYIVSNSDFIILSQDLDPDDSTGEDNDNKIGNGEILPSRSGIKIVLSGEYET